MSRDTLTLDEIRDRYYRFERVYEPLPGPESITDEIVAAFQDQGFIACNNIFSTNEIGEAVEGLRFLINGGNPEYKGVFFERGVDPAQLAPAERENKVSKLHMFQGHEPRLTA